MNMIDYIENLETIITDESDSIIVSNEKNMKRFLPSSSKLVE